MTPRINLFPDPNVANTILKCIPARCTVDFPTVSGFRWLRATTSGSGDIYTQYQLTGVDLPPAGVYHIHAVCYAQGSGALFRVYAGVGARFTILYETGIADNQTKTIDADITIPANTTQLLIRVVPPSTVGKFILIRDILLESKSTYDTGVGGGASSLLHGRHDAARIGASVGRVMSDDNHEHLPDTVDEFYAQTRTQRYGFMQYADSGKRLLCEFLGYGFRPGTVKISCGDETAFTQDGRYVGRYYPSTSMMKIAMSVVSGSPTVQVTDFTVCKGYASTKQALDSLGISRFNGDMMPRA